MSQLVAGTVSVTNGATLVTATADADWTDVTTQSLFGLDDGVWYNIADRSFNGTNWILHLASNYAGPTSTNEDYQIHIDFEPVYGFPLFAAGDNQVASLLNRAIAGIAARLQSAGSATTATFIGDVNYTWGSNIETGQSAALTADRTGTLPLANTFPAGTVLLYFDYKTANTLAFGRVWSPRSGNTLQGGSSSIKPFSGNGTSRFLTDGVTAWTLLDQHQIISQLEDPTNPAKIVTFDISGVGTTPRKIIMPDADVDLSDVGSGGGGGSTGPFAFTDYVLQASDTAVPSSGNARLFVKKVAENQIPKLENNDGVAKHLQFALWGRQFAMWTPANGSTGIFLGDSFTAAGTAGNGVGSPSTLYQAMRRKTYANVVTTLNQQVGVYCDTATYLRSGGFFFFCRFGFEAWTSGDRLFVGLMSTSQNNIVTSNPSTLLNMFGFGIDDDSGAITFMHNAGSGTASKDTIAGQPTLAAGQSYDAILYGSQASGVTAINWKLVNHLTGVDIFGNAVSANIPTATVLLRPCAVMSNAANTAAAAASIGIGKIYCEAR